MSKARDNGLKDEVNRLMGLTTGPPAPEDDFVGPTTKGIQEIREDSKGIQGNLEESKRIREKVEATRKDGSKFFTTPRPAVYGPPMTVRFDRDDLEALKTMARRQGTDVAALIRRAVKEELERGGRRQ